MKNDNDCDYPDPCPGCCGCNVPGSNSRVPDLEAGQMDDAGSSSSEGLPLRDANTAHLIVQITVDEHGHVKSLHDFQTPEDAAISQKWDGGGVRHIAHALLTEAVRREAYVCALLAMTQDKEFLRACRHPEAVDAAIVNLAMKVEKNLADVIPKISQDSVREILKMMLHTH